MASINVTSVQQYTIDRLRISFSKSHEILDLRYLSFKLLTVDDVDVTDKLKSISESNDWRYLNETSMFDLCLKENTSLAAGDYVFILYNGPTEIYRGQFTTNYMEDVRVEFATVEATAMDVLHVSFKPKDSSDPHYQTKQMMMLMKFSIINEGNIFFSDNFENLTDIISAIDSEEISEFDIKLKSKKTLPKGYYDIRLTSLYKSRTFSIVEKKSVMLPYMSTVFPSIGSSYVSVHADGKTVLSVIFDNYLEKTMLESGERFIIRDRDNKNITNYFNADQIALTSYSLAGIQYVTKLDIPLLTDYYALEKGNYTLKWTWKEAIYKDLVGKLNVNWVVNSLENLSIFEDKFIDFDLPSAENVDDFLSKENVIIELNGSEIDPTGLFGNLDTVIHLKIGGTTERTDHFGIPLININKIEKGTYTFILWHDENGDRKYDYMGSINIVSELTPIVEEIYQSNIDVITVVLKKAQPISVLNMSTYTLFDQYGGIDFSKRLASIEDSNIWEPGQTTADRFDILILNNSTIQSGEYNFTMEFKGDTLETHKVSLQYMETRKGFIDLIEQISISKIRIVFSEPQSRQFLLSTRFNVKRKNDGADFTDRFELLENVLKAEQSVFSEIEIPMDHEDSFPAGRYQISFIYDNDVSDRNLSTTIYGYDVDLGYMTNNVPELSSVISTTVSGTTELILTFKNNIQTDLLDIAIFSVTRKNDGVDISDEFEDNTAWKRVTTELRGIKYVKSLKIKLIDDDDLKIERGEYIVKFSWAGIVKYLDDISGNIFLEYKVPSIKVAEIVSLDTTKRTGRLYFELEEKMQYSYFENLKVEVLDPSGNDATSIFSTIQKSNNIGPSTPESEKIPRNNFNLDILDTKNIVFGRYQFIFYHIDNGIRESEYMCFLDITTALCPRIATAEQKAINKVLITLKESISRKLLEEFDFRFVGMDKVDYTDWFLSIDEANDWPEDLREVTSFYIQLGGGHAITYGSYLFTMYNGPLEGDGYIFDIEHLEGASGEIISTKPISLSSIEIQLREEESLALFSTLSLNILNEDGVDYTNQFTDLQTALKNIGTDFFDTLELEITGTIPAGLYTFTFQKEYSGTLNMVHQNAVQLPYLSATYPLLYEVSATKLGETMDGEDALIMWFSPPLEKTLFDNAKFGIVSAYNEDLNFTDRFNNIDTAILETTEENGVTYVNYATLEFANKEPLNREDYVVKFEWDKDFSYMKNLRRQIRLDYILFPLKEVVQIDTSTVQMTFKNPVLSEKMKKSEVFISTIYTSENEDGVSIMEVDFSNQFQSLQDTNDFTKSETITQLITKMGTRNEEDPAQPILPEGDYRFIIAETIDDGDGHTLQYAYSGTCKISFMLNSEQLECGASVQQTSYDKLKFTFELLQLTTMLNESNVFLKRKDPVTGDVKDYTNMFKTMRDSNYYSRIGNNNETETGYYEDAIEKDVVINKIHYPLQETSTAYVALDNGMALPAHDYSIGIIYNGTEYFKNDISLPFMTADPPKISDMEIKDKKLHVKFSPLAELSTLRESSYSIMTNKGLNDDGSIKGTDMSSYFGSILMAEVVTPNVPEGTEITYVSEIVLSIADGVILPSGKYTLTWNWPKTSFLPQCVYTNGLSGISRGIKSARTYAKDTIEITFDSDVNASEVKGLSLAVMNSDNVDVTDWFMSMSESNADIPDDTQQKKYFVKVDDGEDVTSDTYTFTLSKDVDDIDDEDETESENGTENIVWSMNIVYLTTEFPNITRVDNMSVEKFNVVKITNDNASDYIGFDAQLLSSADPDEIAPITKRNVSDYIGQWVRIYGKPAIDTLTVAFDDEVDTAFINALKVSVKDSDSNDVSSYFRTPEESNGNERRKVLNALIITFSEFYDGEDLEKYDISVEAKDGRDLTDLFKEIDKTNNFEDESYYKEIILRPDDDTYIEEYDLTDINITVKDQEGNLKDNFTFSTRLIEIPTTNTMDLLISSDTTVIPDEYVMTMSYSNEPNVEGSVTLYPFMYTGDLPFLSNKLGRITDVTVVDMQTLDVTFSEDIPISVLREVEFRLIDEDGEESETTFVSLSDSNDFNDTNFLSELSNPYVVRLMLEEGSTLQSGVYNLQFWMDLAVLDDDEDETDGEGEDEEVENINTGQYLLWEKTVSLPCMLREQINSIVNVEVVGIDTLKFTLQKDMDVSLLKTFTLDLYSEAKKTVYSDKFLSIEESNFFGMYLMPTDKRFIMYSEDGSYWNRFDTSYEYGLNKVFYHEKSKNYIALCTNGAIMKFDDLTKSSYNSLERPVTLMEYWNSTTDKVTKSLNDYIIFSTNKIVIVGNDGILLVGTINENGDIKVSTKNADQKITANSLTSITILPDGTLIAVGYRGTVITSSDDGKTWKSVITGFNNNYTDVYYHKNSITIPGEEPDPTDEDDEETSVVDEETIDTSAIFIVGTNGIVLYSHKLSDGFTRLDTGVSKGIFAITSHEDKIIAVGDSGLILYIADTEDGFVATEAESDATFAIRDIAFCTNKFVACGANGKWLTSVKGSKWTINSSTSSSALKSVVYVPSQYHDTKGNYFYSKLKPSQDIAAVNFYSGKEVPTLGSSFCSSWTTDEQKDQHLYDIYTQYEFKNSRNVPTKWYQFVKVSTSTANEEDESEIDTTIEYMWKECSELDKPHSGNFYCRMRSKTEADTTQWMYSTPKAVSLPYMTSSPGTITSVALHSPDDEPGVEFTHPYLQIEFEKGNENALHYANYQVLSESGVDFTNYFQSLRVGDILYSSSLNMNGIIIYPKEELIMNLPSGNYYVKWNWMALAPDAAFNTPKFKTKTLKWLVGSVSAAPKPSYNTLNVTLSKGIPKEFFITDDSKPDSLLEVNIRKIPKTENDYNDYNYYGYFKSVEKSTVFPTTGDVTSFSITIDDGMDMESGEYLLKFNNPNADYRTVKEDETNMWLSASKLTLNYEITSNLPTISSVSLEKYGAIPQPLEESRVPDTYSGESDPNSDSAMTTLLANWRLNETLLNTHVGDQYIDVNTSDQWFFIKDKSSGEYRWEKLVQKPYLAVSFGEMPMYDSFFKGYSGFSLNEIITSESGAESIKYYDGKSLGDYFNKNIDYWEFESRMINGSKYITRLYIPLDESLDFPGAEHGRFILSWKPDCIYESIQVDNIELYQSLHNYGNILNVVSFNPITHTTEEEITSPAGLLVTFEREQLKSVLRNMNVQIVHPNPENPTEQLDVFPIFKSLAESNIEMFEDESTDRTNQIYLLLSDGQYLDHGSYTIELFATKPASDIGDSEEEINMSYTFVTPWISTAVPEKISASLITSSGTKNAVLRITFNDAYPPQSSILQKFGGLGGNATVTVIRHDSAAHGNYSECFRGLTASSIVWGIDTEREDDVVETYVKQIDIPMKNNKAIRKGVYNVTFTFPDSSKIQSVPYPARVNYCQFAVSEVIVSKLGTFSKVSVNKRKATLTIKKNPDVNTNEKLAASQAGRVLGVKTWAALLKKLKLSMVKSSKNYASSINNSSKKKKITDSTITVEIKKNKKINPGTYKFSMKKGSQSPIRPKNLDFAGLIYNSVGKAGKDPNAWIIDETNPDGKENCRVYKSYKLAKKRIKKLKRLNAIAKYQQLLCKECRKKKLLSTKKINSCINAYDIPYQYNQGIGKFFKQLVKKWYTFRTKDATSKTWRVQISLEKGKKLDKSGNLINDPNPEAINTYKCGSKPFPGFKLESHKEGKGSEKHISYGCDNYVKKYKPWKWSLKIATVKKGQFPKKNKTAIYFASITWKGVTMSRGYKATKKGKKSSMYKKYEKTLQKMIKNRKKAIAKCNACKKRTIAEKSGKTIGWNAALFPSRVKTLKRMKGLPKLLNVSQKKGGFKGKKKNMGCKKPKFQWATTTYKKKTYTKLTCKNCKAADKTLKTSGFQGIYYKK